MLVSGFFRTHGLNTTHVGSSRDINLHVATVMGKLVRQWTAPCAPVGSLGNGLEAVQESAVRIQAGGLTQGCPPREDTRKWSTSVVTETDMGQPEKPNVRARGVAKECKTHARPELYAWTPPLEALKVVLATGKRGGKVVVLVDVLRAYFHGPVRRRVFVELPPEDYQAGDEHMCELQLVRHARRRTKLGGGAGVDTHRSQIDGRDRVLVCVERLHQGQTHRGNRARRRHQNRWRTVGGGTPHRNDIKKVRDQEASDLGRPRP